MADRTVKVRLEADISDFVTDIGVKAPAAVNKLVRAADDASKRIKTVGADTNLDKLGSKADAAGVKLEKTGVTGETSGKKIGAAAAKASAEVGKLGDAIGRTDKATAASAKTAQVATKNADAQADAVGRLRAAQLKLAEAQKSGKSGPSLAGAEESVAAAERAVKKFEKAGEDAGRGFGKRFGAGVKKWFAGDGDSVFKQLGQNVGGGFFASLMGVLKTPVIGPIVLAAMIAAVEAAAVPVGATLAGGIVTGFGAGIAGLGLVFAAKSAVIKSIWSKTATDLGAEMQSISKPFEATLAAMSVVARRTFATFKPQLTAAFKSLAPALTGFGDQLGQAFARLAPAIRPLAAAFEGVLANLGPAMQEAIGSVSQGLIVLSQSIQRSPAALADFVRGVGGLVRDLLLFLTIMNDANESFRRFTGGTSAVTAFMNTLRVAVMGVTGPIALLAKGLSEVGDGMNWVAGKLGVGKQVMDQSAASAANFSDTLLKTAAGLTASASAGLRNASATHQANVAAALLAGAYDRQSAATQRSIDLLNRRSSVLLSLAGAEIDYQQAVDDATQAVKDNGKTHDITTQKGRDNARALLAVATATGVQRDAMLKANDGNVKAAAAAETGRAAYIKLARQMGYNAAEAAALAAKFIAIPNVTRTAKLTANISDLEAKLATAKAKLKDPKLTATQKAELRADIRNLESGIATAKAALSSVPPSKTVTITTRMVTERIIRAQTTATTGGHAPTNADGGYYPRGMYPSYANGKLPTQATIQPGKGGGLVQWAEGETGGEAFIPLAPSKRDRSEKILGAVANEFGMGLVKSFAAGGINLANGQLVDIAFLLKQLGLPFNPTAGINYKGTLTAANRANRAVVPARNNALAADRAEQAAKAQQAAVQRAITLQQRAVAVARAPKQTTKAGQAAEDRRVAAEQKKLIALQDQLYAAKNKVTKATKASNAADAVYKIRAEAAAKATAANRDALEKLLAQQQAAVELAKQVSDSLQGSGNIGDLFQQSLTGKGLLADLQGEGADLEKFGKLIAQLRSRKLNEDLIKQIIGKGADQGGDLAQAILDGGVSLVNSLNKAQANLENQANKIGAGVANAQYNTKIAGTRAAGGPVTAGKTYRVNELGREYFTAPVDGNITPAGRDPKQYIRSMGGGGSAGGAVVREVSHHYHNTFNGMSMDEADRIAEKSQALAEFRSRSY